MTSVELTPEERAADLTIDRLKQLVGLVEYDEAKDPFPVTAMDAVVFVSGNATQSAHFYQHAFGMTLVGYSGPETGNRDHKAFVLKAGSARFVIIGAVAPDSPYADHHRAHGDGVVDLALEVPDVDKCIAHAREQGRDDPRRAARHQRRARHGPARRDRGLRPDAAHAGRPVWLRRRLSAGLYRAHVDDDAA